MHGDEWRVDEFASSLRAHESWLMARILDYAKRQNYTQYTSTLVCAWQISIVGLSTAIIGAARRTGGVPLEFAADDHSLVDNPITRFAVDEALIHRERGIELGMFLGLLKYYEQAFQDWIDHAHAGADDRNLRARFVRRCFDAFEIALVTTWAATSHEDLVADLARRNRVITNEKNLYLTVFESLSDPALLLDDRMTLVGINSPAEALLSKRPSTAGKGYYGAAEHRAIASDDLAPVSPGGSLVGELLGDVLPELRDVVEMPVREQTAAHRELRIERDGLTLDLIVAISPMLDVSGKYNGSVVFLHDISARKRMEDELRDLTVRDPLTSAANRRGFFARADTDIRTSRRYGVPLSAMMIDIDHFKSVNDRFGHAFGDEVLRALARTSQQQMRATDLFARVGGEEFAALLPHTDGAAATVIAERLRERVAAMCVERDGLSSTLTVSIGVAELRDGDETAADLIARADALLYEAKHAGRNRVCCDTPSHGPSRPQACGDETDDAGANQTVR